MDSSNLIVNYLPSSVTEFDLEDMFAPFGEIESTKIVRDQRMGVSMGFGFVNYLTHEAALAAIEGLNGTELAENKKMKVSLARPAWKANIHSNIYVSGLPADYTSDDVTFLLSSVVVVENVRMLSKKSPHSAGVAVVRLMSEEQVRVAIMMFDNQPIPGREAHIIHVKPWKPEFRSDRLFHEGLQSWYRPLSPPSLAPTSPTDTFAGVFFNEDQCIYDDWSMYPYIPQQGPVPVFVTNLPPGADEGTLRLLFEPFGWVASVKVLEGKNYGFVNFVYLESALYAIQTLNGLKLAGRRGLVVELKKERD